jgi:hypothetical protein
MDNLFNISQLFQDTFGYSSVAFKFDQAPTPATQSSLGVPYYKKDSVGREYFLPVTLGDGNTTFDLPYTVISIRGRKTIIDTPMVEREGSVKEFISMEDYSISIRGFFINHIGQFPEADIKTFRDWWVKNKALKITNALTSIFLTGSQKVVIRELDIPEVTGSINVRPFSIDLSSDLELELEKA